MARTGHACLSRSGHFVHFCAESKGGREWANQTGEFGERGNRFIKR
jgi:hypothetical protein